MSLNKVNEHSNMYPWITHTWNPIRGKCIHDCSYCYMRAMRDRFPALDKPVHLNTNELKTKLGKGKYIFVGSSTDMWADDVGMIWIGAVLEHCLKYPENQYFFQTKNPMRIPWWLPGNFEVCVTVETNRKYKKIMRNAPDPVERIKALNTDTRKQITIEPILDFDIEDFVEMISSVKNLDQVNIGADSGNNNLPEPSPEKVKELIYLLELRDINVFKKKNLRRLLK